MPTHAQTNSAHLGYNDTPIIPGTSWHVHDGDRPQPRVVTPGTTFSQGAGAPSDAIVLFDGKDLAKWQGNRGAAQWVVKDGYMEMNGTGGIRTQEKFPDFQLHVEWSTPAPPRGDGQSRGNSGILINGMYEVQVLDSYQSKTYPDGQAGALYGQTPPLVNASKAPGEWQTYDIIWESPLWDDTQKVVKAGCVTVLHNGVVLHHKRDYIGRTDGIGGIAHKSLGVYGKPHAPEVVIELQDHSSPIRYRNIWVRPLGQYDKP